MSIQKRILLACGILFLDLVVFFLPLTALFLAYVIVCNPRWIREFLLRLEKPE